MDEPIEVIARAVLLRGSSILLCQNSRHGYWYLPGGHVEFGEPAASALTRELREECGIDVQVGPCRLVTEAVFEAKRRHHEVNLVFHVAHTDDETEIGSREPGITFAWFDLAQIQELDVRPPAIKAWLAAGGRSEPTAEWISEIRPR